VLTKIRKRTIVDVREEMNNNCKKSTYFREILKAVATVDQKKTASKA